MIKDIVTDVEQLANRCDEIDVRKDNEIVREITLNLKDTIREYKTAVGLAAPQIGYDKRIFVINFNGDLRTFINPIISKAENLTLSRESCLSFPGKEYIRPRHSKITVMYQTPLGKVESKQMFGLAAIVFQHELDHLDGLTLPDIGLEVLPEYDQATQEEKDKILSVYLDSLDIKQKEVNKEIEEDPQLKQQMNAIKFMEDVATGKATIEVAETSKEDKEQITEKLKALVDKDKQES